MLEHARRYASGRPAGHPGEVRGSANGEAGLSMLGVDIPLVASSSTADVAAVPSIAADRGAWRAR
jgi:hypothetical protein